MGNSTLFRCCLPCRGGSSSAPAANHNQLDKKLSTSGATTPTTTIQTPTGNFSTLTTISLTSPLIDTIVTTTLIGITTASVTATSTSSPILKPNIATPLLSENSAAYEYLTQTSNSTGSHGAHISESTGSPSNIASLSTISTTQQQQSSPSSISSSRLGQTHILTLPHIDEDDEDVDLSCNIVRSRLLTDRNLSINFFKNRNNKNSKVQNDNLINLKTVNNTYSKNNNNSSNNNSNETSLTPSPKIKVSRIKFNQEKSKDKEKQQQSQPLISSSSSLSNTSSESESSVATIHQQQNISSSTSGSGIISILSGITGHISPNKMQAEQGSIAELQKYHNKYLKNRRHTLANVR